MRCGGAGPGRFGEARHGWADADGCRRAPTAGRCRSSDRDGSFEPALVKKGQIRIDGMDDKITGLYAAGLSVRDIRAHLEDVFGLQVSPDLISRVTVAVLDEVREWQSRGIVISTGKY